MRINGDEIIDNLPGKGTFSGRKSVKIEMTSALAGC
jgi:hypothetical protein